MKVNKYVYIFLLLNLFLIPVKGNGQCTLSEIISPDEGCIDERIEFAVDTNDEVLWDFCAGELGEQPEFERIIENSRSFGRSRGIKVVGNEDKGYYLFSVNNTINELTILAFGNSLFNTPNVVQNIDISAYSPGTFDVDVVERSNGYSVFLASSGANSITRLDFPESLFESPEVHPLNVSFASQVNAITIVADTDSFFGFVSQNDMISRLEFVDGIDDISPLKVDYTIPGAGVLRKSAFLKYCDTWIGLVAGYDTDNLYQLQFAGGDLKNDLNVSLVNNEGSATRFPSNLSFKWEGSSFYIHIIGALGDHYFSEVSAGESIPSLNMTSYGKLGISNSNFALTVVKQGPFWVGFSADLSARDLIRYRFPSACDSDQGIALGNTVQKSFGSSGTREIAVETNGNGVINKSSSTIFINNGQAPAASFTYSSSCVSEPVSFNYAEDVSEISSITWDFGDGGGANGFSAEHTYSAPGTYTVILEVVSVNGCKNSEQQDVVVYDDFTAGFSAQGSLLCTNSEIIFVNAISDELQEVTSHTWTINGVEVSGTTHLNYLFTEPGIYTIGLTTELGSCSSTYAEIVEVQEGPSASFIVSDACTGTGIEFANTSTGPLNAYLWDFGDGTTSSLKDPVYTYDDPGDYIVRLTVTNEAGCETYAEQLVTVHALPQALFSTELACSELPVRFIDESFVANANIESWQWDFGNGITSTEQNPEAVFDSAGVFPVSLSVTSTYGCETTVTQDVRVLPSPVSAFSYSTVCPQESVTFTDQSVPPEGESITSWAWDIGGAFSNQRNPSFTFDFPADYEVTLTVQASNQCVGSYEQTITVPDRPLIDFHVENNCTGNEVLFTDLTTTENDSIASWTWDFGGLALATGPEASFEFPRTGSYNVTLTVETASGCGYSYSRQISVVDPPVAAFEANPVAGAPPLEVVFTNLSEGADSYEWYIGEQQVSDNADLVYLFEEFGTYEARLVAISGEGCRDEYMIPIAVVPPEPDLEAADLLPVRDNGMMTFRLTVTNKGNIPVRKLPVRLILDDNISINDLVLTDIDPGATATVMLPFRVTDNDYDFICAEIADNISGFPDTDPSNNAACFTFNEGPHISALFPNPASSVLSFTVYAASPDNFNIEIVNPNGQVVNAPRTVKGSQGIFTVQMDVSKLSQGYYLLKVTGSRTNDVYRFVISR